MQIRTESLDIAGFQGLAVPNRLHLPPEPRDALAILFPGWAYRCSMPLLYYATGALLELRYPVLHVEYDYPSRGVALTAAPEAQAALIERLRADAVAAITRALAERPVREVVLVGKSLGTRALALLLDPTIDVLRERELCSIWLTPTIGEALVRDAMLRAPGRLLAAIGSADPYYAPDPIEAVVRARGSAAVVVVPGADHAMDVPGDVAGSLAALARVTRALTGGLASDARNVAVPATRESAARLLEEAAEELETGAAHLHTAARHFRAGEVPRAGAHAFAGRGHLHRGGATLDAVAELHARNARP